MIEPKYLYHYFELNNGPFRNITEHGVKKATDVQSKILKGFISKRLPSYIEWRFSLEERLKKQFMAKGRKPNRNDPFYFTLEPCDLLKTWYENPGIIKLPLSDFHPDQISFTYPDSMISFQFYDDPKFAEYRKDCNGKVFMLTEIDEVINKFGMPSEDKWKSEKLLQYDRYVEVQVWDDEVINNYK